MLLFANTADASELERLSAEMSVAGVTMNPTMLALQGCSDIIGLVREMLRITSGKIFVPVVSSALEGVVNEGLSLSALSDQVVVKLPSTRVGFEACKRLSREGAQVNMTLCFTLPQVVEAARSGANWISPFLGRIDDAGGDGSRRLSEMLRVIKIYEFGLSVLAASLRTKELISSAILAGVHAVTLDPAQLRDLAQDELSDAGAARFESDWSKFLATRGPAR